MSKKPEQTPLQHKQGEIRYWEKKIDGSNTSTPKKHLRKWRRIINMLRIELATLTQGGL